jgi:hypothetical protein
VPVSQHPVPYNLQNNVIPADNPSTSYDFNTGSIFNANNTLDINNNNNNEEVITLEFTEAEVHLLLRLISN